MPPPPPELGGFAEPVGGAAPITGPVNGTSEVPVVVVRPIDAVRVSEAPTVGAKATSIVQVPMFGRSVTPRQVEAVTRKSAASPPVAIVTALLVTKMRSAVPTFEIVTVEEDVAPIAVAGKIGPLTGL